MLNFTPEEDKRKKELVEARNMADSLVYTTEKAIRDAGDKVTADEKKPVEEAIAELNKGRMAMILKRSEGVAGAPNRAENRVRNSTKPRRIGNASHMGPGESPKTEGTPESPKDAVEDGKKE